MEIEEILDKLLNNEIDKADALKEIKGFEDLGFAKIDTNRKERCGQAEVVFCQGKTDQQIIKIINSLRENNPCIIGTRLDKDRYEKIKDYIPDPTYNEAGRILISGEAPSINNKLKKVPVLCAGTADIPVAEEAAYICELMGSPVTRIFDVGVAGLHRLLSYKKEYENANVIIACAGMEGALPSVIGGLVKCPVIAVPTSVGYGTNFKGLTTLFAMLNSCANGISVVNIDNGFSAGYIGNMINRTNCKL